VRAQYNPCHACAVCSHEVTHIKCTTVLSRYYTPITYNGFLETIPDNAKSLPDWCIFCLSF